MVLYPPPSRLWGHCRHCGIRITREEIDTPAPSHDRFCFWMRWAHMAADLLDADVRSPSGAESDASASGAQSEASLDVAFNSGAEPEPCEDSGAQSMGATEIQQESEDTEGSDAMVAPATIDQKKPWKRRPFGTLEDAMAASAPLPIGATRRPRRKINNVALPKPQRKI